MSLEIDPVLIERFAHGNGTVFVGAGISLGSRLPSWRELMEPLKIDLGEEVDASASYLEIAELYESKHSRRDLVEYLKDRLGDVRFELTKAHELIVGLPVQRIYTTNFDNLLEQASSKRRLNRNVIIDASHIGFSDTSRLSIIKLHGDLSDINSLVISASDYYGYFTKNPAVADLLKVELQTRTVLFLGYSFSDPDLGMILGKVAAQSGSGRPLLYSLQLNPKPLAVQALARRGVKVIAIDAESGSRKARDKVEEWLQCFRDTLLRYERRKHHVESPSVLAASDIPSVNSSSSLIRRTVLTRIEDGLRSEFKVVVVKGEAGIGKTHLVSAAANNVLEARGAVIVTDEFERVIWIRPTDVSTQGTFHTCEQILDTIAGSLQAGPPDYAPEQLDKSEEVSRLLQEHKVLVVIEDLSGKAHSGNGQACAELDKIKRWLERPGPYAAPKSRIVVTSRDLVIAGFVVEVERLSDSESRNLLAELTDTICLRRVLPDGLSAEQKSLLVEVTRGNPQAIKLALGLFNGASATAAEQSLEQVKANRGYTSIEEIFDNLVDAALSVLADDSLAIAHALLAFPEGVAIPSRLLRVAAQLEHTTGDGVAEFPSLIKKYVRLGLVGHNVGDDTFILSRIVKECLARSNRISPESLKDAQLSLSNHFLSFLRDENVVCRPEIKMGYWDALVRDEMAKVDHYWPIIRHVMMRAESTDEIVDYVLLLTHYMDSRFLHLDRHRFLNSAVESLKNDEEKRAVLALLKIDALAWSQMEDGKYEEAQREIDEGLKLVDCLKSPDLEVLALTWQARIANAKQEGLRAERFIRDALAAAEKIPDMPWVRARAEMIAGDVALMQGDTKIALDHYSRAENLAQRYGGEGRGYQTSPRIGLALLEQKHSDTDEQMRAEEQARDRFQKLIDNPQVATGRLQGRYGLAFLAARKKLTHEAIRELEMIRQEILYRGGGSALLALTDKLYRKTLKERRMGTR
jgi:tetratricopeptide (TPR) repeat protein